MTVTPAGRTVAGITHHRAEVNGTTLHYVSAGTTGSPILLVHGFPETWWAFHKLIPLLATGHRVFAVDLRGFGDSAPADGGHNSATAAKDVRAFIAHLNLGPVHLTGQDIGGEAPATRLGDVERQVGGQRMVAIVERADSHCSPS